MMGNFSRQVDKFKKTCERRLRAVARGAVQEVVSQAQHTVGEGGRMRVDTGFLRASIQGSVDSMPSGPTTNEDRKNYPAGAQVSGEALAAVLLRWRPDLGQPLFVGWTANYARYREAQDGFMRGATENWDRIVFVEAQKAEAIK